MPHSLDLILTITGGLAAALALGLVSQRLRLSPIVGYLVAGIAIGPFTPGFVADRGIAEQLAEMGVILLMFGVGLHFKLHELLAVKRLAIPGAIVQIAVATILGAAATRLFGWSWGAGLVFGLAISVASTVVLLRTLADEGQLHTSAGHVAVGWLLVEDIFTILVLVMLPIAASGADAGLEQSLGLVALAIAKVIAMVVLTWLLGKRVIPWLLNIVAMLRSRELFTLAVLVIALGIAVGSAKLFGASMALGAFLAGMIVGQSDFSSRAASEALPMRDAFAVIFFVSMGMLFDPTELLPNAGLVALTLAVILIGKPLAALLVVVVLRGPPRTAATVAVALAQVGEFSFIVAALGRSLDMLPEAGVQALVGASILSITINPVLYRVVEPLAARLPGPRIRGDEPAQVSRPRDPAYRAIVVGYGPMGRRLVELLVFNGLSPTVIELNHETVRELRAQGIDAIYGDASQREILEQAGVHDAANLVFAGSGAPEAIVRQARALHPEIHILTRATYLSETDELLAAGANHVVVAEAEVALAMAEHLLADLGATADQLDRERARVRTSLVQPHEIPGEPRSRR